MKIINQIVDTLKLHFYNNDLIEFNKEKFNSYIDELRVLKAQAQEIHHENNEMRFIPYKLGDYEFHLMATSVNGFSVVLKNKEVTIALRKINKNTTPFCKVEFRSEFLVRDGYLNAVNRVLKLIKSEIHSNPVIKVSEIHLATDIQGVDFNILDIYRFRTRARKKSLYREEDEFQANSLYLQGMRLSGFVFGSGNYMMRVYNKTLEIRKNRNKEYIKLYKWEHNENYNPNLDVWRIEIQYRREKLKTLVDEKFHQLDKFESVLNAIPSLWVKAVSDFKFMDLSDEEVIMISKGYRTFKNGKVRPLTNKAISRIYEKKEITNFWQELQVWNFHNYNQISSFMPVTYSSFYYLQNQVKGLFSQMYKVYGDITPENFIKTFIESNKLELKQNSRTLLDSVIYKQLENFVKIKHYENNYGIMIEESEKLFQNIKEYVNEVSALLLYEHTPEALKDINKKIKKLGA